MIFSSRNQSWDLAHHRSQRRIRKVVFAKSMPYNILQQIWLFDCISKNRRLSVDRELETRSEAVGAVERSKAQMRFVSASIRSHCSSASVQLAEARLLTPFSN